MKTGLEVAGQVTNPSGPSLMRVQRNPFVTTKSTHYLGRRRVIAVTGSALRTDWFLNWCGRPLPARPPLMSGGRGHRIIYTVQPSARAGPLRLIASRYVRPNVRMSEVPEHQAAAWTRHGYCYTLIITRPIVLLWLWHSSWLARILTLHPHDMIDDGNWRMDAVRYGRTKDFVFIMNVKQWYLQIVYSKKILRNTPHGSGGQKS